MTTFRTSTFRSTLCAGGLALLVATTAYHPAAAGSLTQRDVQILAKAIGFLQPPPSGSATVAIVYDPANPASKQDADAIAGYFGDGLKADAATLKPKVTEVEHLASGGFIAAIAAAGVKASQVSSSTQAQHVACVTSDDSAVESGQCMMSVKSNPKVEIVISRAAAASSGVTFGSAFLLMARTL